MPKTQLSAIAPLLLLLGNASCFDTATTLCATGIRCPVDQGCAANQPVCITGLCGNGILDVGEVCDDGNIMPLDSCSADCLSLEICGNGIIDSTKGEECDDGGETERCDTDCSFAACNDGQINVARGEECDTSGESTACDADCTVAFCGDGSVNAALNEICDTGGESSACNIDCTPAQCGDGVNLAANEACDHGGDSLTCDSDCTPRECGDGQLNSLAGEKCDPGRETQDCDTDCTLVNCGDFLVNRSAGEVCDTNILTSECIPGICDRFSRCGDGLVNSTAGEECDDDEPVYDGNGCTANCRRTDGITCESGIAPGQMGHLGDPANGTQTGLTTSVQPFRITGNDFQIHSVPKPVGAAHLAIPLVTDYIPFGDNTYAWEITWLERADRFDFSLLTNGAPDKTPTVAGLLIVLGFDNVFSGYSSGRSSGYEEIDHAEISPRELAVKTKAMPIAYPTTHLTNGSEDFSWSITGGSDFSTCTGTFDSQTAYSGRGEFHWHANSLLLSESIRLEERSFRINYNGIQTVQFSINPDAHQLWLPIVTTYWTNDEANDMAYSANCFRSINGDTNEAFLQCPIQAAFVHNDSFVAGRVLMLESLHGF